MDAVKGGLNAGEEFFVRFFLDSFDFEAGEDFFARMPTAPAVS